MENILTELAGSGILGAVLAWFMYQSTKLTYTIINLVKNNTEAMTGLKSSVDSLTEAQNRRRKEFSG